MKMISKEIKKRRKERKESFYKENEDPVSGYPGSEISPGVPSKRIDGIGVKNADQCKNPDSEG